jgi:hypothetical protein
VFKCWFLGPDGNPRPAHLLPANRESETFIDHVWLPAVGGAFHRVIALCDFNEPHAQANAQGPQSSNVVGMQQSSSATGPGGFGGGGSIDHVGSQASSYYVSLSRRQHVFILEGQDVANQSSLTSPPINLEFRQHISVKINDTASQQHQQTPGTRWASEVVPLHSGTTTPSQHSHSHTLQTHNSSSNTNAQHSETNLTGNFHMFDIPRIEYIVPTSKGFILTGGTGFVAIYERAVDKRENFVETKRICVGDLCITGATLIQNEEKLVCVGRNSRIITFPLSSDENNPNNNANNSNTLDIAVQALLNKENNNNNNDGDSTNEHVMLANGHTTTDLISGGFHVQSIACMDTAREKPFICTVSTSEKTLRLWNYENFECKILHYFRNDEPLAVALHPSGFQVSYLISRVNVSPLVCVRR